MPVEEPNSLYPKDSVKMHPCVTRFAQGFRKANEGLPDR